MKDNISTLMQFAHDDAEIIKVHKLFEQAHLPALLRVTPWMFEYHPQKEISNCK